MLRIAVDGTASAGKGALARGVAAALRLSYVDTGAMYRTVGLFGMRLGFVGPEGVAEPHEESVLGLAELAQSLTFDFIYDEQKDNPWRVFVAGEDVSNSLRTQEVGSAASFVSSIPEVRRALFECQRRLADQSSVIMDGRDIGTVVFPDAELKLFMTASPETRAARRYKELLEKGEEVTYAEVLKNVEERDRIDSTRTISPLTKAKDAIEFDNSDMGLEEQFERIYDFSQRVIAKYV